MVEAARRSLVRKLLDCCRSIRETCGKPPSIPSTVAEVLDQYDIADVVEMCESGAGAGSAASEEVMEPPLEVMSSRRGRLESEERLSSDGRRRGLLIVAVERVVVSGFA